MKVNPVLEELQKGGGIGPSILKRPDVIPTGIPILDHVIFGIGGVPRGKVTELFGPKDTCKTLTCKYLVAAAQAQFPDETVIVIDSENAWDIDLMRRMGIDTDSPNLLYFNTNDLDYIGKVVIPVLATKKVLLLIWDSPANADVAEALSAATFSATRKKGGEEKNWRDRKVAVNASAMSYLVKAINRHLVESNTAVVYPNHMKSNISMTFSRITEKRAGSHSYLHNVHIAIRLRKVGPYYEGAKNQSNIRGVYVSYSTSAMEARNKFAPEAATSEGTHPLIFLDDSYVSTTTYYLADEAVRLGVVQVKGNSYSLTTKKSGLVFKAVGIKKYRETVQKDPIVQQKIATLVRKMRQTCQGS